jgi:pimeloyl-ACP methyl ester carboxylesterase
MPLFSHSQDDSFSASQRDRLVLLFIPGNPGVIEFYREYLQCLFALISQHEANLEIIAVQHAGHGTVPSTTEFDHIISTEYQSDKELFVRRNGMKGDSLFGYGHGCYTLKEQVDHKCALIDEVLCTEGTRLVLIGHSVGAYMAVECMKRFEEDIEFFLGLFPTIENIGKSTKAQEMRLLLNPYGKELIKLLSMPLQYVKKDYLVALAKVIAGMTDEEADITIKELILSGPKTVENCVGLGIDEMNKINDLDLHFYDRNIHKMVLYYGKGDKWTEPSDNYYEKMIERFPHVAGYDDGEISCEEEEEYEREVIGLKRQIIECKKGIGHAFVLSNSVSNKDGADREVESYPTSLVGQVSKMIYSSVSFMAKAYNTISGKAQPPADDGGLLMAELSFEYLKKHGIFQ